MDKAIDRIRAFNRFYTSTIGVLDKHILKSDFSLSEARVLFEMYQTGQCTARVIMQKVGIDEGYLSRIIERFVKLGLARKTRSESDKRAYVLELTPKGKNQFQKINAASAKAIKEMISPIPQKDLELILTMMDGIQNILSRSYGDTQ